MDLHRASSAFLMTAMIAFEVFMEVLMGGPPGDPLARTGAHGMSHPADSSGSGFLLPAVAAGLVVVWFTVFSVRLMNREFAGPRRSLLRFGEVACMAISVWAMIAMILSMLVGH